MGSASERSRVDAVGAVRLSFFLCKGLHKYAKSRAARLRAFKMQASRIWNAAYLCNFPAEYTDFIQPRHCPKNRTKKFKKNEKNT